MYAYKHDVHFCKQHGCTRACRDALIHVCSCQQCLSRAVSHAPMYMTIRRSAPVTHTHTHRHARARAHTHTHTQLCACNTQSDDVAPAPPPPPFLQVKALPLDSDNCTVSARFGPPGSGRPVPATGALLGPTLHTRARHLRQEPFLPLVYDPL
jgi:hypothetical protein